MAIQGLRSTSDHSAGARPQDWRHGISQLEPNGEAPLYALSTAMGAAGVLSDPHFHWFEEILPSYRFTLSASITNAVTTIPVVADPKVLMMKVGDLFYVENSEEVIRVTETPTTNASLKVARSFGNIAAAAVNPATAGVNPNILYIGNAYEEGSKVPDAASFNPDEKENQTQIFRDALSLTGTDAVTDHRTGDQMKEDKRRTAFKHATGIERAFILGQKTTTTMNNKPLRTTSGILEQIPTVNKLAPPGADAGKMSLGLFEEWSQQIFAYGANEKLVFCGNSFLTGINQMVRLNGSYELGKKETEYGMSVRRLYTPHGTLVLKSHPLLNQVAGGTTGGTKYYGMDSWGIVLDMMHLKYMHMKGRDTKYQTNLEVPGTDGKLSGFITEAGLRLKHRETHFVMKGITGGKIDS